MGPSYLRLSDCILSGHQIRSRGSPRVNPLTGQGKVRVGTWHDHRVTNDITRTQCLFFKTQTHQNIHMFFIRTIHMITLSPLSYKLLSLFHLLCVSIGIPDCKGVEGGGVGSLQQILITKCFDQRTRYLQNEQWLLPRIYQFVKNYESNKTNAKNNVKKLCLVNIDQWQSGLHFSSPLNCFVFGRGSFQHHQSTLYSEVGL